MQILLHLSSSFQFIVLYIFEFVITSSHFTFKMNIGIIFFFFNLVNFFLDLLIVQISQLHKNNIDSIYALNTCLFGRLCVCVLFSFFFLYEPYFLLLLLMFFFFLFLLWCLKGSQVVYIFSSCCFLCLQHTLALV